METITFTKRTKAITDWDWRSTCGHTPGQWTILQDGVEVGFIHAKTIGYRGSATWIASGLNGYSLWQVASTLKEVKGKVIKATIKTL